MNSSIPGIHRNPHFAKLSTGYLFPEIQRRTRAFQAKHPEAQLINLGIGDTTRPLPTHIADAMARAAKDLATLEGYSGYGPEQGQEALRRAIANAFYPNLSYDEIFVSDGAACDIGRLQLLFGSQASVAIQNPTYPAYFDSAVIQGMATAALWECHPGNHFFPDLSQASRTDLIYICSPNNPTGTVATYEQLSRLVAWAKSHRSIIIFDAAYTGYIQDPSLPKSIYDIPGAEEVAIEVNSFSKLAGFTGVRLGWTVVPRTVRYADNQPVWDDWNRVVTTVFNGASHLSQQGGLAVLSPEGRKACHEIILGYLQNAALLKQAFERLNYEVYGGTHAPFIWVRFPQKSSWEVFEELLQSAHIVSIPGSGFGSAGEGFIRLSAFAERTKMEEAVARLAR